MFTVRKNILFVFVLFKRDHSNGNEIYRLTASSYFVDQILGLIAHVLLFTQHDLDFQNETANNYTLAKYRYIS